MMTQNTRTDSDHATIFAPMSPHLQPWLSALQHANEVLPKQLRFSDLHADVDTAPDTQNQQNTDAPKIALQTIEALQRLPVFALTVVVQQQALQHTDQQDNDLGGVIKAWATDNPLWQVIEVAHADSPITLNTSIHQKGLDDQDSLDNNKTIDLKNDRLTPVQTYRYILLPTEASAMSAEKKTAAAHILDDTLTSHLRHYINTLPITEDMGGDAAIDCHIVSLAQMLRPHRIACFDMDSTLIEQEVINALAKEAGIEDEVSKITDSAMRGEIDFDTSFTQRMALLAGLSIDRLPAIFDTITPSAGARSTIAALKALGYHTVLISGGFTYFAEKIAELLGIDEIHANVLDSYDGLLTGKVIHPIVNKERKAEVIEKIAKRMQVDISQTVAIGDGANDIAMMSVADLGIAYHAKPIVRSRADAAINATGLEGVLYVLGYDSSIIKKQPVR